MVNQSRKENYFLETIGMLLLGGYCFFSAIFFVSFAKLHLSCSFFNFPIFVGEITMLLCMVVSLLLFLKGRIPVTKQLQVFFVYLLFILLWGTVDYFEYHRSGLAFRNSLLFFYPIFAFFAFMFYRSSFFSFPIKIVLLIALWTTGLSSTKEYSAFVGLILTIILLIKLPKPWSIIGAVLTICLWNYDIFLSGARTWVVAISITFLFCIYVFGRYFINLNKRWKTIIGLTLVLIFFGGLLRFADKEGLKTLITPVKVIETYKHTKELIREREPVYHRMELTTNLYNESSEGRESFRNKILGYKPVFPSKQPHEDRDIAIDYNNMIFRIVIWEDMFRELWQKKALLGVGMGWPQRSRSIEILNWAPSEWQRDGWITPHNSFLHLIYRAGILGVGIIVIILGILINLIKDFIYAKSYTGILLTGAIIYGLVGANFLLVLELPYYAIPFWSIFGLTLAYRRDVIERKNVSD